MEISAGHHQLCAEPQAAAADGPPIGVEDLTKGLVESVDPEVASVPRGEHLDVPRRIDPVAARKPAAYERHDLIVCRPRVGPLDHEQVAAHALRGAEVRWGAAADRVGALHDHAPC